MKNVSFTFTYKPKELFGQPNIWPMTTNKGAKISEERTVSSTNGAEGTSLVVQW